MVCKISLELSKNIKCVPVQFPNVCQVFENTAQLHAQAESPWLCGQSAILTCARSSEPSAHLCVGDGLTAICHSAFLDQWKICPILFDVSLDGGSSFKLEAQFIIGYRFAANGYSSLCCQRFVFASCRISLVGNLLRKVGRATM